MVDSALQRARKRALGEKAAAPAAPQDKAPTTSVRTVKLQDGTVVPVFARKHHAPTPFDLLNLANPG